MNNSLQFLKDQQQYTLDLIKDAKDSLEKRALKAESLQLDTIIHIIQGNTELAIHSASATFTCLRGIIDHLELK